MSRRKFIKQSIALAGLGAVASCRRKPTIKGTIAGASSRVGHLLRDRQFAEPSITWQQDIVIIGGGISGLSAAYHLNKSGIKDFVVLELEQQAGGNSTYSQNEISAFPMGAHYIPVPNNSFTEYLQFLEHCSVITAYNEEGLPVYNEYYQCFDPHERLYINGRWQEGLVPNYGIPAIDKKQVEQFLNQMNVYRYLKGKDGKDAFAIPVDTSSVDGEFVKLDQITFKDWLLQNSFTSEYLHWYVNYCCRDDYGTRYDEVSAWAGIHYFASRKGKGANAEHQDVLTWPEGNGWLVKQLASGIEDRVLKQSLAVSIQHDSIGVLVAYYDVQKHHLVRIKCKQCIIAVPQFVAARLLKDNARIEQVKQHLHYAPWMVANLKVNKLEERSGAPASWDNVVYGGESLGYIVATHQLVQQTKAKRNLTYYLPLTTADPVSERKKALHKTHSDWTTEILSDLQKIHPNIAQATEEININIWGHAMAKPLPGLIHGSTRKALAASIGNIHFAHTDIAGISIFEEAFYQGLKAAKKVEAGLS